VKLFAVVVNWNGGGENLICLRALMAAGMAPSEIVFVDNASSDGSREAVAAEFDGLVLFENESNEGYGHGVNKGVQHALAAGADAVLLVNNDLELPGETLRGMQARLEADPSLGIVGPRVVYRADQTRIWAAGGMLTYRQNLSTLLGHGQPDGPAWQAERVVDYVPGCAMLVTRAVFERVGLLDGAYFAYHEDLDYCLRASEAGFGVWLAGELVAIHDAHTSTGGGYNPRRKYMMGVNTIWFLRAHGTPGRWLRFLVFDVATLPLLLLVESLRGRAKGALAKALGTWHGLRGRRITAELLQPGAGPLW